MTSQTWTNSTHMKFFLFLSAISLFAFNATAQDCPVKVFSPSVEMTSTDSSYIKNVLAENDSCSTHLGILLQSEIILSIKTLTHDRVYIISRADGAVTFYFEVYPDGRIWPFPLTHH